MTLRSTLARGKILSIWPDYMLPCMLLQAWSRDLLIWIYQAWEDVELVEYKGECLAGRCQERYRMQCVAGGRQCMLAEIMMSVAITVWTMSSVYPPQHYLIIIVLKIAAINFAEMVVTWISGRGDLQLSYLTGIRSRSPVAVGHLWMHSVQGWWQW